MAFNDRITGGRRWAAANKIQNVFLLLLCCATIKLYAQPQQEYYTVIPAASSIKDTATVKKLVNDAFRLFTSRPDSAMAMVLYAERLSRQIDFKRGIFFSGGARASLLQHKGMHDSAIAVMLRTIPYARYPENAGHVHILYNNLGLSASGLGRYLQADTWFRKSLEAMHTRRFRDNNTDSPAVMVNMAIIWGRLGEQDIAMQLLREARELLAPDADPYTRILILVNMGEVSLLKKDYDSATWFFNETLHAARLTSNRHFCITAFSGLAKICLEHNAPEQALAYMTDSLHGFSYDQLNAYEQMGIQHTTGVVYMHLKDYGRAWPLLTGAYRRAVALNHSEKILEFAPDAALLAAAMSRYDSAYHYMQVYSQLRDAMFEQEKISSLRGHSAAQLAEKDRTVLAQQLQIARQQSQIQSINFWIAATVTGILLLLAGSGLLYRSYRQRQKLQQVSLRQLRQQQELERLKARVQGEEQERNRIAAGLHNGVAAQLWATRMNMDIFRRQEGLNAQQQQQLTDIYRQLEETAQEVRNTAHNMMPALLLDEGLGAALASLCEKAERSTGLVAAYQEYGSVPRLDREIEHLLYRMVQELVQNAMKHAAGATHLLVQLSCSDAVLNITVEDNGQGFSWPQEAGRGEGLQHIVRNVQALKGHIDIKSSSGKGTAVYMELDIQNLL